MIVMLIHVIRHLSQHVRQLQMTPPPYVHSVALSWDMSEGWKPLQFTHALGESVMPQRLEAQIRLYFM